MHSGINVGQNDNGYEIQVSVIQSSSYKEIFSQLLYKQHPGLQLYIFRMSDKNSNYQAVNVSAKHSNYPRIGHQVIEINGEAFIFGGTSADASLAKTVFKFNFEKLRIQPVLTQNTLEIQGFSLFSYQGLIYLWAGNVGSDEDPSNIAPSNKLFCFDGKKFAETEQFGEIPSGRAFHCSAWVANRFLLIYGGFGKQLFSDWCILDMKTKTWNSVLSLSKLPINCTFELGWVNGRGILFSTEVVNKKQSSPFPILKNELFQVRITDFKNFKIKIDSLAIFQEGQLPPSRSYPTLLFSENSIFLIGGVMNPKSFSLKGGAHIGQFCNDTWAFDFESLSWKKNSCEIAIQFGSAALKFKNKIYSFGGIKPSTMQLSSSIEIISLDSQPDRIQEKFCQLCRYVYGLSSHKTKSLSSNFNLMEQEEPRATISTSFISKISELIQNPLQALCLLLDNSLNMAASTISIKLLCKSFQNKTFSSNNNSRPLNSRNTLRYLYIGDNSEIFHLDDFLRFFHTLRWRIFPTTSDQSFEQELSIHNQYVNNLRLGSLRLGRSCLYISRSRNGDIIVVYFTDNPIDSPDGSKPMNCFYFWMQKPKQLSEVEQKSDYILHNKIDKQIIKSNVSHILCQQQYMNLSVHSTRLYIFDVNELSISELKAFPQMPTILSNSSQPKIDLTIPYNMGEMTSLYEIARKLYLVPYYGRQIEIENSRIIFLDLADKFKEDVQRQKIQKIQIPFSETEKFKSCCLYRITSVGYSMNSVYIYHENRFITAVSTREKNICGYIEIPKLIETDIFKTKLAKIQDHRKLLHYIESKDYDRKRIKVGRNIAEGLDSDPREAGKKLRDRDMLEII